MAVMELPAVDATPEVPAPLSKSEIRCCVRLHAAFHELVKAYEYARLLNTSTWEFATELSALRRLKVSSSDLRWMVRSGLVNYSIETTKHDDCDRRFTRPNRLLFCKRTCFVLTPKGAAVCNEVWGGDDEKEPRIESRVRTDSPQLSVVPHPRPVVPTWDRDRQELRVGPIVVKRFRVPAASQEAILAAFEEESWPPRIDDPLPPRDDLSPKRRLQETIKSLNRNQKHPLIRFVGDGTAQGILWEYCGEADADGRDAG
jgi:hypothetical protein